MSVVTRQSNIIWVAFFALETVEEFLKEEAVWRRKKKISSAVESSIKYIHVSRSLSNRGLILTNLLSVLTFFFLIYQCSILSENLLVYLKVRTSPSGVLAGGYQFRFLKLGSVKILHSPAGVFFSTISQLNGILITGQKGGQI